MRSGRGLLLLLVLALLAVSAPQAAARQHLGFDRNEYPGDDQMRQLRKVFSYSGYWLNRPPGATEPGTTWAGKRKFMNSLGYGFLVLYQGRIVAHLPRAAASKQAILMYANGGTQP